MTDIKEKNELNIQGDNLKEQKGSIEKQKDNQEGGKDNLEGGKDNLKEQKGSIETQNENLEEEQEYDNFDILFYQNEMLNEEDDKLINKENIDKMVLKFYNNYHSEEYQDYLKLLKIIPKKFNRKSYEIKYEGDEIIINKIISDKQRKKIGSIKKPIYDLNVSNILYQMKNEIKEKRNKLMIEYKKFLSTDNITTIDKNTFLEHKKDYIEKLENYYAVKKYYLKINDISYESKKKILTYQLDSKITSNDKIQELLTCDVYNISSNLINIMNDYTKNKIDLYNEIVRKIKIGEEISDEEIKDYLNKDTYNKNIKILNNEVKKINNYIDFIVKELPDISNAEDILDKE